MIYPFFALFVFGLIISTNIKISQSDLMTNIENDRQELYYTLEEERLVFKVYTARNNYIKIYNKYPTSIDELISKGLLDSTFLDNESNERIYIENGLVVYSTNNVKMSNLYIASNFSKYNSILETSLSTSLRNQSNTISLINSNDSDVSSSVNFSSIVENSNEELSQKRKSDLEFNSQTIDEENNIIDNELLKRLTF